MPNDHEIKELYKELEKAIEDNKEKIKDATGLKDKDLVSKKTDEILNRINGKYSDYAKSKKLRTGLVVGIPATVTAGIAAAIFIFAAPIPLGILIGGGALAGLGLGEEVIDKIRSYLGMKRVSEAIQPLQKVTEAVNKRVKEIKSNKSKPGFETKNKNEKTL